MNGDRIRELSEEMREVAADPTAPDFFGRFDQLVVRFAEVDDPATIHVLLGFFDDDIDDALLYGIIHTVERFEFRVYVEELLSALPTVVERSEQWARILVLRLLNSAETLALVQGQIPSLSPESLHALRVTLVSLVAWAPEFEERAAGLLAELA